TGKHVPKPLYRGPCHPRGRWRMSALPPKADPDLRVDEYRSSGGTWRHLFRRPSPKYLSQIDGRGGRRFFQDQSTLRARRRSQFAKPVLFLTKSVIIHHGKKGP